MTITAEQIVVAWIGLCTLLGMALFVHDSMKK